MKAQIKLILDVDTDNKVILGAVQDKVNDAMESILATCDAAGISATGTFAENETTINA